MSRRAILNPVPRCVWPVLAVLLAIVPVASVFTTSRIFFVRDLAMYFWPHHLWLRATWAAGEWPWWNPYAAAGQSGIADSLNHVFLLPITALRLMASDVVGFNLWVALPLPVAALGAYLLLRTDASRPASFFGAVLFAITGPIASTPNFPNLSWTAALMPWVLWRARLLSDARARAFVWLAVAFGIQALCGEPVILAGTAACAVAIAVVFGAGPRWRRALGAGGAIATGALLAAVQLLPLADAARNSARSAAGLERGWVLHPLNLFETVLPHLFGHYYHHALDPEGWMLALNDQLAPFFFSLYLGAGVLLWAAASAGHDRPAPRRFWLAIVVVSVLAALGEHTPVYPAIQLVVPPLRTLRSPVKYVLIASLALSALVSLGWDALSERHRRTGRGFSASLALARAAGVLALLTALPAIAAPESTMIVLRDIAAAAGVPNETAAATDLRDALAVLGPRLAALCAGWALLAWIARGRERLAPLALAAMCVLTIADAAVMSLDLNPTMPVSLLRAPDWVRALPPRTTDRLYVGGRWTLLSGSGGSEVKAAVDGPSRAELPAEYMAIEARSLMEHETLRSPSGWGLREVISYDMPALIPREYVAVLRRFVRHTREGRLRFLERAGVRYCALPYAPSPGATPMARFRLLPEMGVYDCFPAARRVRVVPRALVEDDLASQVEPLFERDFDVSNAVVLPAAPPDPSGRQEAPAVPATEARIVDERPGRLVVAAAAPAGGYVVVFDAYHRSWRVTVDGQPAPLLRAFAAFRAVRIAGGAHEIVFTYFPDVLAAGATISATTTLALALAWVLGARRPRRAIVRAGAADRPQGAYQA